MADTLNDEWRKLFEIVNFVALCGIVSVFGIIGNIINIVIFHKQGFTQTVNIAFFALAVSDFCCLVILLWVSLSMNPLFAIYETHWIQPEVMYLSGAWPDVCFCRITSFITVYITAERYLCITLPLKVKQIITPKKTIITLCIIYSINLLPLIPEYTTAYLDWKYVPEMNRTLLGLVFTSSRNHVEGLCHVLHSVLGMTSFAGVVFFTTVLGLKLRQTSKWRKNVTSGNDHGESMSKRDKNTVKMIVLIAGILIMCYTPGAIIALTTFVVGPEFNIKGRYVNICEAVWSMVYPIQAINSSVNIFIYYCMSSKYRDTFYTVFYNHQKRY